MPIMAVESLLSVIGHLPMNGKVFFEGQEEIGLPNLPPFVVANAERLAPNKIF